MPATAKRTNRRKTTAPKYILLDHAGRIVHRSQRFETAAQFVLQHDREAALCRVLLNHDAIPAHSEPRYVVLRRGEIVFKSSDVGELLAFTDASGDGLIAQVWSLTEFRKMHVASSPAVPAKRRPKSVSKPKRLKV
ncbi:MAG TPA: hypothetical protein VM165_09000 [Planctomycetaceae bacterium]|nr:hypothetical protein [Planctomycetaceae bacterium]